MYNITNKFKQKMETPINNEEQKPKGPGRPRVEHKMPTEWEKEMGR